MIRRVRRNGEEANLRIIGSPDFFLTITRCAKAYLHVGLSSAQPDVTDQHIVEFYRVITARDL